MKRVQLYGLDITLTCNKCGKECHMESPFSSERRFFRFWFNKDSTVERRLLDNIHLAYAEHQARAECIRRQEKL